MSQCNRNVNTISSSHHLKYQATWHLTMYLQNNLPDKPFEYIYYDDMRHIPMNDFGRLRFQNDIANRIRRVN